MGVKNLWDILESCKKTLPLHHLQNKRLCVDLSCWIVELQTVYKSHSCIKDNKVYLKNLFHRLRALIALNCSIIFVTDGSIPAIKLATYRRRLGSDNEVNRDKVNACKVPLARNMGSEFSCMIKEAKILGKALGIPCLDGLEEGEAQCALLNSESLCDGCFTADSDIFLFGAKTVYRDIDLADGGHVISYELADVEEKLGFGRNSLIALALLLGSDYSPRVHGFGRETACQIVKSLGDHIVLEKVASEGLAFAKKITGLKKQGQNHNLDENKENSQFYKHNSSNIQYTQKDNQLLEVIDAYLRPKCHSPDSEAVHRVLVHYPFQRTELQRLCSQFFDWTSERTDEYILPKIAERDLRRFSNLRSSSSSAGVQIPLHEIPVTCPISAIVKRRKVLGKECFEVTWKEFYDIESSVVSADLIERACPEKIVEFEEEMLGKKKIRKPRKKSEKSAAMEELEQKLQGLLRDIDAENDGVSRSAIHHSLTLHRNAISEVTDKIVEVEEKKQGSKNNNKPRKQPVKTAAMEELDRKLQGLWRGIDSEDISVLSSSVSHGVTLQRSAVPEVIDIVSPSPSRACKSFQLQSSVVQQIDVIHLSDSETD